MIMNQYCIFKVANKTRFIAMMADLGQLQSVKPIAGQHATRNTQHATRNTQHIILELA